MPPSRRHGSGGITIKAGVQSDMRLIKPLLGAALTLAAGMGIAQQAQQTAPALVPAPVTASATGGAAATPPVDGRRALSRRARQRPRAKDLRLPGNRQHGGGRLREMDGQRAVVLQLMSEGALTVRGIDLDRRP